MSIAIPDFFWFLFTWNTFFYPLIFSLYVSLELKWVSWRQHVYRFCFCIHWANLCLLVGAFSPFTFKVIVEMYVLTAILLTVWDLVLLVFFLPFFCSLVVWWLSLVLCLDCFFLFACIFIVDFHFAFTMRFWYRNLHIYKIVLSCWSLNCKYISSVLHLYPPLLTISDFGGIFVHGWFRIFSVYLPSLVSLVICGIFVSCCGLFFSA